MTKGVRVIWPGYAKGEVDEIEYLYGVDVDHLGDIPEFRSVPTFWPHFEGGTWVEYEVNTRVVSLSGQRRALEVTYDEQHIEKLVAQYGEHIHGGTNAIVLKPGASSGLCRWRGDPPVDGGHARWETFDMCAPKGRPLSQSKKAQREAFFRGMVLDKDGRRCVLTRETTVRALEAAHLVPAKWGRNDLPVNGITLRRDLHKLFDDGLFTFEEDGSVRITDAKGELSVAYREMLEGGRLEDVAYERVKVTLSLELFRNRRLNNR